MSLRVEESSKKLAGVSESNLKQLPQRQRQETRELSADVLDDEERKSVGLKSSGQYLVGYVAGKQSSHLRIESVRKIPISDLKLDAPRSDQITTVT
jgi:hypothetical protein